MQSSYSGRRPFTDLEIDRMVSGCTGNYAERNRLLILLGCYTGFRAQELLVIRIRDVWDGLACRNSVCVARRAMKGKKRSRTMPLHPRVCEAIIAWIGVLVAAGKYDHERYLFSRKLTTHPISRRQAANIIRDACKSQDMDIERVATHSLRKSFARKMWESELVGRDMARMARLLGHENFSNTLRYLEFGTELDEAVLKAA